MAKLKVTSMSALSDIIEDVRIDDGLIDQPPQQTRIPSLTLPRDRVVGLPLISLAMSTPIAVSLLILFLPLINLASVF